MHQLMTGAFLPKKQTIIINCCIVNLCSIDFLFLFSFLNCRNLCSEPRDTVRASIQILVVDCFHFATIQFPVVFMLYRHSDSLTALPSSSNFSFHFHSVSLSPVFLCVELLVWFLQSFYLGGI